MTILNLSISFIISLIHSFKKDIARLDKLMSMKNNFGEYRDLLFDTRPPGIPFLLVTV